MTKVDVRAPNSDYRDHFRLLSNKIDIHAKSLAID